MITIIPINNRSTKSEAYLIKANGGGGQMQLRLWGSFFSFIKLFLLIFSIINDFSVMLRPGKHLVRIATEDS